MLGRSTRFALRIRSKFSTAAKPQLTSVQALMLDVDALLGDLDLTPALADALWALDP